MTKLNLKKSTQMLNYFSIRESSKINIGKSIMYIFLSDILHLRKYGRTISRYYNYTISQYGISSINIQNIINDEYFIDYINIIDEYNYTSIKELDDEVFSITDIEIMNSIYEEFHSKDIKSYIENLPEFNTGEYDINSRYYIQIDMKEFFVYEHDDIFYEQIQNLNYSKMIYEESFLIDRLF